MGARYQGWNGNGLSINKNLSKLGGWIIHNALIAMAPLVSINPFRFSTGIRSHLHPVKSAELNLI
jgi:hypothetical protein